MGIAAKFIVDNQFFFSRNMFFGVNVNVMFIDVSGEQNQLRYNDTAEGTAGPLNTIDSKINSLQVQTGIYTGIAF
jgi:hypothetical protein